SLSTIGSKVRDSVSSAVATATSLCLDDWLNLFDERAVQLRPAVAEQIELVLAGNHVVLVARLLELDVGDEERLLGRARLGESPTVRVDDLAPAAELAPAFLADPVGSEQVDAVL